MCVRTDTIDVQDSRYNCQELDDADTARAKQFQDVALKTDAPHQKRAVVDQGIDSTPLCEVTSMTIFFSNERF